ncbi:SIS domain-containing protein, partial [Neisseria meningitidis]|nr:SIS domain-containing protein [Neisseria meningitidis]
MTTLQERVAAHFAESIRAKQEAEKVLAEPAAQAAELMLQCLMNDGKILACGNGGS